MESQIEDEKHKQNTPVDPAASKEKTLMFASTSDPTGVTTTVKDDKEKRHHTLDTAMLSKDSVKGEIMCSVEVLKNKYSYQSCASRSSLFCRNVQDSKIAQSFTLGKAKCSFVVCCGIAPYCLDLLMGVLERTAFVVISFDEAFNIVSKKER